MTVMDTEGTILKRGDGADPEVFTKVPQITSIDPVGSARTIRQVTDLSDTDVHQHKLGLKDMPEISVEGWYDPDDTEHQGVISDHDNGTNRNWEIDLTDGSPTTTVSFSALVSEWSFGAPNPDGDVPFRFTLKPQSVLTIS